MSDNADNSAQGSSDPRPKRAAKPAKQYEPEAPKEKKPRKKAAAKKGATKKAAKGGKKAGKKAKGGPKRAKSAYILFCSDKRSEVKKTDPDLSFTDIARKLAELWKNVDSATKKHYENMASKDKVRYQKEVSNASASAEPASESANDQDDDAEDDE